MPIVDENVFEPSALMNFEWDEADPLQYFCYLPEELHNRLLELTHRANLALTIGCANWIVFRFAPAYSDPEVRNYVNAIWAEMTTEWRCDPFFPIRDEWRGPVRGPLYCMIAILTDAIFGYGDNPVIADRAALMFNLAEHVIDPLEPFSAWFEEALTRLARWHSWSIEDPQVADLFADRFPQGCPVAPDALIPGQPYDTASAAKEVERFVERERRNGNRFVVDESEFRDNDRGHEH